MDLDFELENDYARAGEQYPGHLAPGVNDRYMEDHAEGRPHRIPWLILKN